MKKLLISLLALIYFTVSSGMMMNIHYCMGKMSSVKVGMFLNKNCRNCKGTDHRGCCHTESRLIKIEDNQQVSHADYSFSVPVKILPAAIWQVIDCPAVTLSSSLVLDNPSHSPGLLSQDINILHCVYRI
jgi:hypothetical protein